jgi:rRNA maturation endonuclease Nob1
MRVYPCMLEKAEDSSWLTTTDIEQVSKELHYLKQFDQALYTGRLVMNIS